MRVPPSLCLALAALPLACSDPAPPPTAAAGPDASAEATPAAACGEGFRPLDEGAGCAAIVADACPPGSRAELGATGCVPVGVTACPEGFVAAPSGWGCAAVLPPAACAGPTRERLGSASCAPLASCGEPFPPPGATLVVGPAVTEDATHFRSVGAALAAATAGAVIAVDRGVYREALRLERGDVAVVGRCPADVVLEPPAGHTGSGFVVGAHRGVRVARVTLRGYNAAISVLGGELTADDVLVDGGTTAGVVVANAGAAATLRGLVVRGIEARGGPPSGLLASHGAKVVVEDAVFAGNAWWNLGAARAGTELVVRRTVARGGVAYGPQGLGAGVAASQGAAVRVDGSALLDHVGLGAHVSGAGSSLTLAASVVAGTRGAASGFARGVAADGGRLAVTDVTVTGSDEVELFASAGADAAVSRTTLLGRAPPLAGGVSRAGARGARGLVVEAAAARAVDVAFVGGRSGLGVLAGGALGLEASLVAETVGGDALYEGGHWNGFGAVVERGARLDVVRSTVESAVGLGVLALGDARLDATLVRGTRRALGLEGGGRGVDVERGGSAELVGSAVLGGDVGLVVMDAGSSLVARGSSVEGVGARDEGSYGVGAITNGESQLLLEGSTVTAAAAVGVASFAAWGRVEGGTVSRCAVALHVAGVPLVADDAPDGEEPALRVSRGTRFVGNGSRVGAELLPLPRVPLAP